MNVAFITIWLLFLVIKWNGVNSYCETAYFAGRGFADDIGNGTLCEIQLNPWQEKQCFRMDEYGIDYIFGMAVHPITYEIYLVGSDDPYGPRIIYKFDLDNINDTLTTVYTATYYEEFLAGIAFSGCIYDDSYVEPTLFGVRGEFAATYYYSITDTIIYQIEYDHNDANDTMGDSGNFSVFASIADGAYAQSTIAYSNFDGFLYAMVDNNGAIYQMDVKSGEYRVTNRVGEINNGRLLSMTAISEYYLYVVTQSKNIYLVNIYNETMMQDIFGVNYTYNYNGAIQINGTSLRFHAKGMVCSELVTPDDSVNNDYFDYDCQIPTSQPSVLPSILPSPAPTAPSMTPSMMPLTTLSSNNNSVENNTTGMNINTTVASSNNSGNDNENDDDNDENENKSDCESFVARKSLTKITLFNCMILVNFWILC